MGLLQQSSGENLGDGHGRLFWYSMYFSTCFSLSILYIVGRVIYNIYFHPLSKYPGPRLYAASRLAITSDLVRGRGPFAVKKLHDRYGDVVRIAPNELSYCGPDSAKDIYGHRVGRQQLSKDLLGYPPPLGGVHSIITAPHDDHARFRRLLSHAFSEKALRDQEPLIKEYVDLLLNRLHENSSKVVDMVAWYNWTTFDVIGDLTFGEPFGCLRESSYHAWVRVIFEGIKIGAWMQTTKRFPPLTGLLSMLLPKSSLEKRAAHNQMTIEKTAKRIERAEIDRPDFLSMILKEKGGKGMTRQELESNAAVLIVAGSETSATWMSGLTYLILQNPRVYEKLVAEIRSTFAKEEDINLNSVNSLKYLHAVITESARIYPPVPSNLLRIIPEEGDKIGDQWVPPGTIVGLGQWSTFHSARNFRDPDTFIPERWLDEPAYMTDCKSAMQPFSVGPRNCLGRNLAYVEMRLILARVFWNFDMTLDSRSDKWIDQRVFLLWEKSPLYVKLTPVSRN